MVAHLHDGLVDAPGHFNFVLGMPGGMGATTAHLDFLRTLLPDADAAGAEDDEDSVHVPPARDGGDYSLAA